MILDRVGRYVFLAPIPYFLISLSLFTLILGIQQAAKFAETLNTTQFPGDLTVRLFALIIPGVLVFTLPMAAIMGVAVGYSRLLNDSELTALNALGVSTGRVIRPAFYGGIVLTLFAFYAGFFLIPATAHELRRTAVELILERLTSPVEPKSFFTGFPGKVIYVQSGDMGEGSWRNIFIHWREEGGVARLITAETGKLNTDEEGIELHLRNAVITQIGLTDVTTERAGELRLRDERINQHQSTLLEKIRRIELSNDEVGLTELLKRSDEGADEGSRRDASISLHKRLALCLSPLILAWMGAVGVVGARRGGKISGVLIAVLLMLVYYLLFLVGEQLTRGGVLQPVAGLWVAPIVYTLLACTLTFTDIGMSARKGGKRVSERAVTANTPLKRLGGAGWFFPGLLDRRIFKSMGGIFTVSLVALNAVFLLFTLFELLKFIALNRIKARTVAAYLLMLVPYASLILIPVCTLIAVLVCFALMVRRSESVVWLNTGLSASRLILPALFFSLAVGLVAFFLQESIAVHANRRQNELRRYIRSGERSLAAEQGERWVSVPDERRIYLLDLKDVSTGVEPKNLSFFEFEEGGPHLTGLVYGERVIAVEGPTVRIAGRVYDLLGTGVRVGPAAEVSVGSPYMQSLNSMEALPGELSIPELSGRIRALKREGGDTTVLQVEVEARRASPLVPLVLTLTAAPFVFLRTRQKLVGSIYYSVAFSLLFLISLRVCLYLGAGGYLPPTLAAWACPVLFSSLGLYLLTRVRT